MDALPKQIDEKVARRRLVKDGVKRTLLLGAPAEYLGDGRTSRTTTATERTRGFQSTKASATQA